MRQMSRILRLAPAILLLIPALAWAQPDVRVYHGLSLYGPGKYPADFTHFDWVNPDAPKGGRVKLAAIGTFDSFNPFIVKGLPASGLGLIYDTLTVQSYDEPFSEYGLIAEKVELPEDRSWVIYHINPQARFHDGQPVTAEDVVFSFDILVEKGDPLYQKYYASVQKVEALDERRVKFTLGDKVNKELALILGQLAVLPKHDWEGKDFSQPGLDLPLGGGAYKIKEFQAGRTITYERVRDYWAKDHPINKGRYNFDLITYDYYRDATVALQAFKAGEFDYRFESNSKDWATAYTGPAFDAGLVVREQLANDVDQGMQAFAFNTRRPLFQDRRVREALSHAFDFEWTNKNLFYGQYTRSDSFFSNSELAARGLPSEAELKILGPFKDKLPPEVFTREYQPPKTDGSGSDRRNLRTAAKILKDAGWVIKNDKLVNEKTGDRFEFEIILLQPDFERVVLPFTQNLAKLGVEAKYRTIDLPQYINRMREYDYDMIVVTLGQSESPGNEQREYWGSQAADIPGTRNYAGIKDPVIDQLIEALIQSPTREDLVNHCRALDRVLLWNHFVIPQWHPHFDRVAYWTKLVRPEKSPKYALDFFSWWVDPAKEHNVLEYLGKNKGSGS